MINHLFILQDFQKLNVYTVCLQDDTALLHINEKLQQKWLERVIKWQLKKFKINFLSVTLTVSPCLILFLCYFETLSLFSFTQFRMISLCLSRDLKKPKPETERFVSIFIPSKMTLASSYSHPPPTSCSVTSNTICCNCNFLSCCRRS